MTIGFLSKEISGEWGLEAEIGRRDQDACGGQWASGGEILDIILTRAM